MKVVDINPEEAVVVDAEKALLGRLASKVAKLLLSGDTIIVINAEKAIISGPPQNIIKKYQDWQNVTTSTNPLKGPFHYKRPDLFVKRRIRGMLPWKKARGKRAYDNLRVYIGEPRSCKDRPKEQWEEVHEDRLMKERKRITVGELCERLR